VYHRNNLQSRSSRAPCRVCGFSLEFLDNSPKSAPLRVDGNLLTETDHVAGRSVSYDYDNHGRIASAETSDSAWGLKYDYDDFGNRTSQRVTQGSAYGHEASYVRRTCLG
jgi:YD repeat-containing protein